MKKLAIVFTFLSALLLINTDTTFAAIGATQGCLVSNQGGTNEALKCEGNLFCKVTDPTTSQDIGTCQPRGANIGVTKPSKGFATLGDAISKVLIVAFAIAVLIVLVMLILGSFEWITSGGDKEAVGKARNRIINALIGLAVLAVAFALANVAARFTGLDLFNIQIPSPDPSASGF